MTRRDRHEAEPAAYFVRLTDERFRATRHTGGAWSTREQHFGPMAGLLTHVVDRFVIARGGDDLVTARITFDILGTIAIEEFDVRVEVVRPGRTIELLEAIAAAHGRPVVRARIWRLLRRQTHQIAGGEPDSLPPPDGIRSWPLSSLWPGGFIASIEYRPIERPEPGRTRAWVRTPLELVEGEDVTGLARFVGLVDTANGIAVRVSPKDWFYPNVDLSIHLFRQPAGAWVGLDTVVVFGPDGQGLTSTTLHDQDGPVGRAEQTLTIRRAE